MIVFFSSCELVEFHYHLFLQTLLSGSGAPAPGQLPSGCTLLKFLRLHGNMDQEVSKPRSRPTECALQGQHWLPPGLGRRRLGWAAHGNYWKQSPCPWDVGRGSLLFCSPAPGAGLIHLRAHRPLGLHLPQPAVKATEHH